MAIEVSNIFDIPGQTAGRATRRAYRFAVAPRHAFGRFVFGVLGLLALGLLLIVLIPLAAIAFLIGAVAWCAAVVSRAMSGWFGRGTLGTRGRDGEGRENVRVRAPE